MIPLSLKVGSDMENDVKEPEITPPVPAQPVVELKVAAKKAPAKKAGAKKAVAKKAVAKKAPAKKAVAKKAVAKKALAKKAEAKKPLVEKATVKKAPAKKPAAKKPAAKKPKGEAVEAANTQKPKKVKLVRDSFTMPGHEYQVLQDIKKAALKAGVELKKSDLLRIGVSMLKNFSVTQLDKARATLTKLRAGRPKK
jgi:hypothetical protein